mgnify:CR=1 FL=1
MRKNDFPIFESWFSNDDISASFLEFARKVARIENRDRSLNSEFIFKTDVIDHFPSSAKNFFAQNFSFGCGDAFFIENELIKWFDICSIFVGSRKVIEKIPHRINTVLSEEFDIEWSRSEEGFHVWVREK